MADSLQNPPPHASHVVRRVPLHRNIAIDPRPAQRAADAIAGRI